MSGNPVREAIERRIESIEAGRSAADLLAGYVPCEDDTPELTAATMAAAAMWIDLDEAPTDPNPSYGLGSWDF